MSHPVKEFASVEDSCISTSSDIEIMSQDEDKIPILEISPSVTSLAVKTQQKPAAHKLPMEILLHIYRSCVPDPGVVEICCEQVGSKYGPKSSRSGLPGIAATCLLARDELLKLAIKEGFRYISRPTLPKPMLLHSNEDILYFTNFMALHAFAGRYLPPYLSPRFCKQHAIAIGANWRFWQNLSLMSDLDSSEDDDGEIVSPSCLVLYNLRTCSVLVRDLMRYFQIPRTLYLVACDMHGTINHDSKEFMVAEGCVVEVELMFGEEIRLAIDNDHVWARMPQITFVTRSELDECLNKERAKVLETRF